MPGGRPRIFGSPEEMDAAIEQYFAMCADNNKPVTLTGLIFNIGLSSRESFDEYGRREEFSDSVKFGKLACEMQYEENLHGPNATGSIFALKNFGWVDKREIDATVRSHEKALDDLD